MTSPAAEHRPSPDEASPHEDIQPEEERSWLYYLAEISYRRLLNRAIATFGPMGHQGWVTNIRTNIRHHQAFEDEMNIW
jgi:hypothetical protein